MGGGVIFLSLFYFFGGDETHLPHPRRSPYTPPVETPAPAHPEWLHSTGNRADRARCNADRARQDTHARTMDTPGRSRRRRDAGGCAVCPAKCTISDAIFVLIYICIFLCKALDYSHINDII
nr:MAG TPA_asm: hypothetical protein [Caudoviricetes sp.]